VSADRGVAGGPEHQTTGGLRPDLMARIRRQVAAGGDVPDRDALATMVRQDGRLLGREDLAALPDRVRAELLGAGPLQALIEAPGVSDVLVNGPCEVWVDRGHGLERTDVQVPDVRALAVRLAAAGGRRLDDAAPAVDASLPDGTRVHAVLPPVAADGPVISLRALRRTAFRLPELVEAGSVGPLVVRVLVALVAGRANLLVSGATGTGKTTLLATLLSEVDHRERIVCIEEARELAPDHPHVVHLVTRRPNVEGAGEVDLVALVRHALRMRPDRIVLGECRGAEVREVLTALNTGHEGGCATVHANALADVPARIAALGALAGMTPRAVAAQAVSALDAVVHLRRDGGRRYVAQMGAVVAEPEAWRVEPVVEVGPDGAVSTGGTWPRFARRWLGEAWG
jgi:pilus assembly protein CpaF